MALLRRRGGRGGGATGPVKAVGGRPGFVSRGRSYNTRPRFIAPTPVKKPHPPILVGAFVPKALDRAGRLADGFTGCCAPVDALISFMNSVKEAAQARGRDAGSLQMVMRCLVTRTDQPVPEEGRAVAVGT